MRRYKAFTLTELIVGVVVMIVTLGVATMSLRSTDQTAKREAERLAAYIYKQMGKAERIQKNFCMTLHPGFVRINWNDRSAYDESYKISTGCRYHDDFPDAEGWYNANKRRFRNGGTITIYDANENEYHVVLAGITEGRVRISAIKPTSR